MNTRITELFMQFIDGYYVMLFLDAAMLILMYTNRRDAKKNIRISLIILIILTGILGLAQIVDTYYGNNVVFTTTNWPRVIASYLRYVLGPASELAFLSLAVRDRRKFKLLCIPAVLNAIIFADMLIHPTSDHPLVVGFGLHNTWGRGPLGFTSHILAIAYVIVFVVLALKRARGKSRGEAAVLTWGAVGCMLALLLETEQIYAGMLYPTILASGFIYYLFLYMQINKKDPLTGVLNRRCFLLDEEERDKDITGLIWMDMNGLKRLNDEKGHHEGDKGLIALAGLFESACPPRARAYRTGGDEFAILCFDLSDEMVLGIVERIREDLKTCDYSASVGFALRNEGESIKHLEKRADKSMYVEKRAYYVENGIERRRDPETLG